MFKLSEGIRIIILSVLLLLVSFFYIVFNGNKYTLYLDLQTNNININDISINVDENIIKINKKIENGKLILELNAVNKGKTFLEVNYKGFTDLEIFYVHNFNIITRNQYFGISRGARIIPICFVIIVFRIILLYIKKYKNSINVNLYKYENIAYLAAIIYLINLFILELLNLKTYNEIIDFVDNILNSVDFLSVIFLPVMFIVSILVMISNIKLLIKEEFTWKNMLGTMLGAFLCILTIIPKLLYSFTFNSALINVHNLNSIYSYIYRFIEVFSYIIVSYLECVLVATIILGFKAARHIPKLDKDYIIILGCMINKDGSLPPILRMRVDKAIEFSKMQKDKTNKDLIFVPSGGKGEDEVMSEAQAMKNYLLKNGINEKNILVEDKSKNTYENIKFSSNIIRKQNNNAKIAFSTTNYHVFRAGVVATSLNINIEGIGAPTKRYFWVNAFIREFVATIYSEKKKHITLLLIIILFTILMLFLLYFSNVL